MKNTFQISPFFYSVFLLNIVVFCNWYSARISMLLALCLLYFRDQSALVFKQAEINIIVNTTQKLILKYKKSGNLSQWHFPGKHFTHRAYMGQPSASAIQVMGSSAGESGGASCTATVPQKSHWREHWPWTPHSKSNCLAILPLLNSKPDIGKLWANRVAANMKRMCSCQCCLYLQKGWWV